MSTADEMPEIPEPDAVPLTRWERVGASMAGVLLAGAGTVAVFVSSNQAGSVALLLAGAVLLIMAINGSPLTRARYQDYEVLMARRRHAVAETIEQEAPQDARQALQVLSAIDPRSSNDPFVARVSGAVYEREVAERLSALHPGSVLRGGLGDSGIDIVLQTASARIGVNVKEGRSVLTTAVLRAAVQAAVQVRDHRVAPIDALLLVTNRPLPQDVARRLREVASAGIPVAVVRWVDDQDDDALEAKVQELTSRINPAS
ncbi:hypothetical protein [Streptomyces sp. RerS4]|uniref:hypothetical protein n=1 Tax=Streptomyces sp. RerS4 TaxID=2942449 RepID=UPI00201C70BF|nr:hypothetical protein [Streptomyces sp. RerS4]UQX00997.1 hypothetical protein M4D82_10980 [Streptomyces sp. RerS4]